MNRLILISVLAIFTLTNCSESDSSKEKDFTAKIKVSAEKRSEYIKRGGQIVDASYKALSDKLKSAVADKGISHALKTCNMHASLIADSLAEQYDATIKRTAIRIRNQGNEPTTEEKHIIKLYQKALTNKQELTPVVLFMDSVYVNYYSPIIIKPMCLNCHGDPGSTLADDTYETILSMYPTDRAIGYKEGDLRGIWSVKFKAK